MCMAHDGGGLREELGRAACATAMWLPLLWLTGALAASAPPLQ